MAGTASLLAMDVTGVKVPRHALWAKQVGRCGEVFLRCISDDVSWIGAEVEDREQCLYFTIFHVYLRCLVLG